MHSINPMTQTQTRSTKTADSSKSRHVQQHVYIHTWYLSSSPGGSKHSNSQHRTPTRKFLQNWKFKVLEEFVEISILYSHKGDHRILLCTIAARSGNTHINYILLVQARTSFHDLHNFLENLHSLLPNMLKIYGKHAHFKNCSERLMRGNVRYSLHIFSIASCLRVYCFAI